MRKRAARAAAVSALQAPSDYESWLWFARTMLISRKLGTVQIYMERARKLITPGMELDLIVIPRERPKLKNASSQKPPLKKTGE
jgi:hypothetical protein